MMSDGMIEKKHKRFKAMLLGILLLILLLGGLLWFVLTSDSFKFDSAAEDGSLDGLSQAQIEELMQQKVDESMLSISINSSPEFASGSSKGSLRIENSASNRYNIRVKITRDDNGKVIYYSDAIRPGQMIKEDKLDVTLAKGNYDCKASFEAYDTETNKKVGEAAAVLTIIIKR